MRALLRIVSFAGIGLGTCLAACSDDPVAATADAGIDAIIPPNDSAPPPDTGVVESGADGAVDATPDVVQPPPLPFGMRDRCGRPYLAYLFSTANREAYNTTPPPISATDPPDARSFGADLQSALAMLDALDGADDWGGGTADAGADDAGTFPHPLVNAWIGVDSIILDPNKPFSTNGFMEVETQGNAHTTSGGRWLGEDALDITMSYVVKKQRTGVSDGVSAPGKAPSLQFPYLASPY